MDYGVSEFFGFNGDQWRVWLKESQSDPASLPLPAKDNVEQKAESPSASQPSIPSAKGAIRVTLSLSLFGRTYSASGNGRVEIPLPKEFVQQIALRKGEIEAPARSLASDVVTIHISPSPNRNSGL